jgi:hypothetical protein
LILSFGRVWNANSVTLDRNVITVDTRTATSVVHHAVT